MLARHNGSIEFSKFDLGDSEKIVEVLNKILYDESYTRNSENLAKQLENQPIKPKELMVRHAEFAARSVSYSYQSTLSPFQIRPSSILGSLLPSDVFHRVFPP